MFVLGQSEITLSKTKEFKKEFKEKESLFRIEAVIHDGQWYDIKKWAKVALVSENEVEQYIKSNSNLFLERNNSYRVSYDEIIRWYKKNNIDLLENVVPNNFVPKLWCNKTEPDHFEDAPKRLISSVMITCDNSELLNKIRKLLWGYGKFQMNNKGRLLIYTTDPNFIKDRLKTHLTLEELSQIIDRSRSNFRWRELTDYDEEFLEKALQFYVHYAAGLLKPHQKTLDIFLPNRDEQYAQILDWVMAALQKFDETAAVPFSGYLANVLQRWPYDLPDLVLGRELAKFQREKSNIINNYIAENDSLNVPKEYIKKELSYKYDSATFDRLFKEDEQWQNITNATELNWGSTNEERLKDDSSISIYSTTTITLPPDKLSQISYKILKVAEKLNDIDSFLSLISQFGKVDFNISDLEISDDFKYLLEKDF